MSTFLLVVGAVVGIAYLFRHIVVKGKQCTSKARLVGKTVIVTGKKKVFVFIGLFFDRVLRCTVCYLGGGRHVTDFPNK